MPPAPRQHKPPASPPDIRLLDLMLRVAVSGLMLVAGTWWALGRMVAEKLLTVLAMPIGILWLLLLVSVLATGRAGRRDLMLAAAIPWTILTLLGNGMVAEALVQSLEQPYRQIQPLQSEPFESIIVLGGGTSVGGNGRIQGNTAGDRILLTAQMFHAGLTKRILCSGRRITELAPDTTNPAEESLALLVSLKVPKEFIGQLKGRNTSEEMHLLSESLGNTNQRMGLVTSAWHLTRALRLAERNNLTLEPLPADFIAGPPSRLTTGAIILNCIPEGEALWRSAKVFKEYLGIVVKR
jgi:uncharacterized SAM-binding protein YcdF (DUF218 family)